MIYNERPIKEIRGGSTGWPHQQWVRRTLFFFKKKQTNRKNKTKKKLPWNMGLLVNSHFCCIRAALNLDSFLGACWGGGPSGATSSCFLSSMVGRAGGAMVRWGTDEGIGSFSTTVPEKACRTGSKRESERERQHSEKDQRSTSMTDHAHPTEPMVRGSDSLKCLWSLNAAFCCSYWLLRLTFNDCSTTRSLNLKSLLWEFCYVLIKGCEAQRCHFHELLHNIGILQIPPRCNWDWGLYRGAWLRFVWG